MSKTERLLTGPKRLWQFIWHPHQRLWNVALIASVRELPGGGTLVRAIIFCDSILLLSSVLWRIRWHQRQSAARALRTRSVLYIDCGTHTAGIQVRAVDKWLRPAVGRLDVLAFEANPTHYAAARKALRDIDNLDLRNLALVGPNYAEPTVTLYLSGKKGKGDSLFAAREESGSVSVPAARLSDYLASSDHDARLLRMNIEGAEVYVIEDLVASGLTDRIDGYFGMWDDLSKIDPAMDSDFRRLLRENDLRPIPFNDRDSASPGRQKTGKTRLSTRIRLFAIRQALLASAGGYLR